ncbi:hypothetical protein FIBSPDRAFT_194772 [Athelia psychrophila]|uniref:Uncharacterized protein n=1 Tax=Athelia psychrophila TaxID=1759441 RepID=A0A166SLN3_9AGAM|nr:hypothetical protein FIBSPDRAFT_194772 [Fibularhizoctonia sp. CBS 109695]
MDLFDLTGPSRSLRLLLGGLSDSNTLQVLNRLGFLASLVENKKEGDESRLVTLNGLLGRDDYIFLATVTLLARLATNAKKEADKKLMKSHLVSHLYRLDSLAVEHRWESTDQGIAGRIDHCLALESIRSEAINTIAEIAPIAELREKLNSLGVTKKLVDMLSSKFPTVATSSATALVALARSSMNVALATPTADITLATPAADASPARTSTDVAPATHGADGAPATPVVDVVPATPAADAPPATPLADVALATPAADAALATSWVYGLVALVTFSGTALVAIAASSANALVALTTSSTDIALATPAADAASATPTADVAFAPPAAGAALATPAANVSLATPLAGVALAAPTADVAHATSSANAPPTRDDHAWGTTFDLVLDGKANFNSLLKPDAKPDDKPDAKPDDTCDDRPDDTRDTRPDDDTRSAAAMIIADLVDYLMKSQTTDKPFVPSAAGIPMTPDQVGNIIDKDTIELLNDMLVSEKHSSDSAADALAKQKLSDSAADAMAKLSCHAEFRDLIFKNAASNLVTMLSKHSGSAAKALAELMTHTGPTNPHDVQRAILGHGRKTYKIGVTSKKKTLLLAIVGMLKESTYHCGKRRP